MLNRITRPAWVWLLGLALVYTLLNAGKSLHIDDPAYVAFARQISQHPLDPYGFGMMWYYQPEPANEILAPPVFLYWLALAMRVWGDHPLLWKVSLFPVCWLFTWAVYTLFRRFCHDNAWWLTCLVVLSPAYLPALNLMLDVPVVALGLTALHFFLEAVENASWRQAVAAGLLAGLATQTKYTAFLLPAVMFLYCLFHGGWRYWVVAVLLCGSLFLGWEFYTARLYGQSHFLANLSTNTSEDLVEKLSKILPGLLSLLGSVGAALVLLALAALGAPRRVIFGVGVFLFVGYLVVGFWDVTFETQIVRSSMLFAPTPPLTGVKWHLSEALFGVYGLVLFVLVGGALYYLLHGPAVLLRLDRAVVPRLPVREWRRHRDDWFLTLWLGLEGAGYFALTPFPAVRRVMGLFLVLTLVVGRLATLNCRRLRRPYLIPTLVGFGVILGLIYHITDDLTAFSQEQVVQLAHQWIEEHRYDPVPGTEMTIDPGQQTVWYVGHWGFQFYAERAGMKPIILPYQQKEQLPFALPPASYCRKGDWVVVPDWRIFQQGLDREKGALQEVHHLAVTDPWPWRTLHCYYGGSVGIDHHLGSTRQEVRVFRVTDDFEPVWGKGGFPSRSEARPGSFPGSRAQARAGETFLRCRGKKTTLTIWENETCVRTFGLPWRFLDWWRRLSAPVRKTTW